MKNLKDQLEEAKKKADKIPNEKLRKSIEEKLKHVNKPIKK